MADELHIAPLTGRDPRLPTSVYGYLSNPLLQEDLSFLPLATCFDYAHAPGSYRAEASWKKVVSQRFGAKTLPHWRVLRSYAMASIAAKKSNRPPRLSAKEKRHLQGALAYLERSRSQRWAKEFAPWRSAIAKQLGNL